MDEQNIFDAGTEGDIAIERFLTMCKAVSNGRSVQHVANHLYGEVDELREEIKLHGDGEEPGEDGIVGEAVDVILCALDVISVHNPDMTGEEVAALMHKKFTKWYNKYHAV